MSCRKGQMESHAPWRSIEHLSASLLAIRNAIGLIADGIDPDLLLRGSESHPAERCA